MKAKAKPSTPEQCYRRRCFGRIYFADWSMPDPEYEQLHEALHTARHQLANLNQSQAYLICSAAESYLHLVSHPAGTARVIQQLRAVRRAIRRSNSNAKHT